MDLNENLYSSIDKYMVFKCNA